MARKRTKKAGRPKRSSVVVKGHKLILTFVGDDLDSARHCLDSGGTITIQYSELRIREFPTDMTFETGAAGPFDGDSDSDSGGDMDID